MVAIQSIGPRICQIVEYNDAVLGSQPAIIAEVNADGTVDLRKFAYNVANVLKSDVKYDFAFGAADRWRYFDPPVGDSRTAPPKVGQLVEYKHASAGPSIAMICAVNADGSVNLRAYPPANGTGAGFASVLRDDRGVTSGTWRYYDPPPHQTFGPRQGQVIVHNHATYGPVPAYLLGVNANGTVNLNGWGVNPSAALFAASVPYDQSQRNPSTWSYPDPAVN